jgi:hypothetical protein
MLAAMQHRCCRQVRRHENRSVIELGRIQMIICSAKKPSSAPSDIFCILKIDPTHIDSLGSALRKIAGAGFQS